ncbi:MAG: DUF378 domain-containing protein [Butyrivibrio sp.]
MFTKILDYIALVLTIIGAINWGLIGFFQFDLVAFLFGSMTVFTRIVYAIIGICGIYMITIFGRIKNFGE